MEFFRNPNIDFLGKKWYFIAFSLVFSVAGVCSMLFWHGLPLGIDFRAGTLVYVKYTHSPNDAAVRAQMDRMGLHNMRIQYLVGSNDLLLDLPQQGPGDQAALDKGQIVSALQSNAQPGKQ